MADQISDAILDAILTEDKHARVAVETLVKTGMAIVAGEVRTSTYIDLEDLVREVILDIGYNSSNVGFDGASCAVLNAIGKQSSDIAMGVDEADNKDLGAGDQGLMFGYATNETDVLMPAPSSMHIAWLNVRLNCAKGVLPWLRPDAKSQVTLRYENGKPVAVDAVVLSTQHEPNIGQSDLREAVLEEIIKPVLPEEWLHASTKFHINPTGQFIIGGGGRLWFDRPQNHRGHLRWYGASRWWSILGKKILQSGSFRRLCGSICCQKHRGCGIG